MEQKTRPLLTIGMIFKNEIRCLERCLEALRPLREAVSCELILADTGSSDGSREIAARYADVLFDFPWVDDFSAARNAVMDRAEGKWYLTIDADEYLDTNFRELERFLENADAKHWDFGAVIQRNYKTLDMAGDYTDAMVLRLVRMSAGVRYKGAIHEAWPLEGRGHVQIQGLPHVILHHDGYAGLNEEQGQAKRARNLRLLREELKREPENLRAWLQYIESGNREADFLEAVRQASGLVERKCPGWKEWGAAIFRHAVWAAMDRELPEAEEWIRRARKWFPDSLFTRIDVEYAAMYACMHRKAYAEAIGRGEAVLKAIEKYRAGQGAQQELLYDSLLAASAEREKGIRACIVEARLLDTKEPEKLERLLAENWSGEYLTADVLIHALRSVIVFPLPEKTFYIEEMKGLAERAAEEPEELVQALDFLAQKWEPEKEEDLRKLAWLESLASALVRAWKWGQEDKGTEIEIETETEAGAEIEIESEAEIEIEIGIETEAEIETTAKIETTAEVEIGTETGIRLARFFTRIEEAFLPRFYGWDFHQEELLRFLPAFRRFGWHCVQAFEALNIGDRETYVQELRQGSAACESMRDMAGFLLGKANGF